jgi:hypothetical protein
VAPNPESRLASLGEVELIFERKTEARCLSGLLSCKLERNLICRRPSDHAEDCGSKCERNENSDQDEW